MPHWVHVLLANIVLAVAYAVLGTLALLLVRDTGLAAPIWPAAGVAFALVYVRGAAYLPGVVAGSLLTNIPALMHDGVITGTEIALSIAISLGAALGALVGALLVRKAIGPHPLLMQAREILLFLLLGGLVTSAITASVGTTVQVLGGVVPSGAATLTWLTWWVGDAIGIIVFAPICMMVMPEQADVWRSRRWKIIGPSIIVITVALVAIMQNASLITDQRNLVLRQQAYDAAAELESELRTHTELLNSVTSLRHASDFVSQQEFRTFTASFLARHPDLQAVAWDPIVPGDQRAAFESGMRQQPGLANFQVTERNAAGELVPAASRPEYVPVAYIEPLATNAPALGFDVYSNAVRADAIDRASRLAAPQVTAPVDLVQEVGGQKGVLMFVPSYAASGELEGYAVGVYRLNDLLAGAIGNPKWQDWNFTLSDTTPGSQPTVLGERMVDGTTDGPTPTTPAVIAKEFEFGGRTWSFEAWPSESVVEALPPATPMLLLLGTLLIALLLEAFLLLVTGTERHWRSRADSSSYAAHHDELTGLLNRRGFFRELEAANESVSDSSHVLMFLDLDGFKPVNDEAGHDVGDELLRSVASSMRAAVRDDDVVARIGGDEFAIVVFNCPMERGQAIAESIQRAVSGTIVTWHGQRFSVGASIGLTQLAPDDAMSVDDWLRQADEACYDAKHAGRNTVRVYEPAGD